MTGLKFRERMTGHLTVGETEYNEGRRIGRRENTRCAYELEIDIVDIDRFLAAEDHPADIRGTFECGALGGTMAVVDGRFNLFEPQKGPDPGVDEDSPHLRMRYLLHVIDREGRELTVAGFKDVQDSQGLDIWTDTTTLMVRVIAGHVDVDAGKKVLAAGVMTISHLGLARMMLSMRARGGSPWRRLSAIARFQRNFVGTLIKVYGGRQTGGDQPDFPHPTLPVGDPFRGMKPDDFQPLAGHPGLWRRIIGFEAVDGVPLTLHNVRRDRHKEGDPPVLCIHGTSVRGDIFIGPPGGSSMAKALVDAGYDVWILNWRGSIDMPPLPYSLDDAAINDHPAAIAEVLSRTKAKTLKAVVHCQGSTSFTITALMGLADDVTHVVSSAVSLHTHVAWRSVWKGKLVLPLIGLRMRYVSAQWAVRSPTVLATGFARIAKVVRRECDNPVCALSNYMYGVGPDVLWVHEKLGPTAHEWLSREFGFVPYKFLKQINRSSSAKHIVPVKGDPGVPDDLLERRLPAGQRWTFLAGTKNKAFLPSGQIESHAHFEKLHGEKDFHQLVLLPGFGHLDPIFGKDAEDDVYPKIVKGLAR